MSFDSLGLSAPILDAVAAQGYDTPSPIQAQAIPAIIDGKDVMAAAQTGTGKTAGFTLPLLQILSEGPRAQQNNVRALVLTPTHYLLSLPWHRQTNAKIHSKNCYLLAMFHLLICDLCCYEDLHGD